MGESSLSSSFFSLFFLIKLSSYLPVLSPSSFFSKLSAFSSSLICFSFTLHSSFFSFQQPLSSQFSFVFLLPFSFLLPLASFVLQHLSFFVLPFHVFLSVPLQQYNNQIRLGT